MNFWFGKMMGAAMGFVSGGPLGSFIGLVSGHILDKFFSDSILGGQSSLNFANKESVQQVFFQATFRFMGRLAKADGRVSEAEIQAANQVMERMSLASDKRQIAIQYFNQGKDPAYDLNQDLNQLRVVLREHQELVQVFMEIQLSVAYADGELSNNEKSLFLQLCRSLDVSRFQFEWINSRVKASQGWGRYRQQASYGTAKNELSRAYQVLGVEASASSAEIKKAYRKLMSQHHPDKLIAQGLPEEMMRIAKEKTQEIQTAYDLINKARKA